MPLVDSWLLQSPLLLLFTQSCLTLSDPMHCSIPGSSVLQHPKLLSLLKFMSIESVMPSTPLILCYPLLLLPSIFPSIRAFSNELALHIRWLKYWSFSISISPSNEYSELTSFRMDWLDLLSVQGTESSPTWVQQHQFFGAQLFLWSNFHIHTRVLEKPQLWLDGPLLARQCLCF